MKTPYNTVHCLSFTLTFPSGLSAGDGSFGNELQLARNGKNELVLRGTSIAGVLRHTWEKEYGKDNNVERYFGSAAAAENGYESPLVVSDIILNTAEPLRRTHHLRNRHTGAVLESGLYSIEIVPPKSTADVVLWYNGGNETFITQLASLINAGLIFGGNSNRGVGLASADNFRHRKYDLTNENEFADYLNAHYTWRKDGKIILEEEFVPLQNTATKNLTVNFTLNIPRGQDILVSADNDNTPQRITAADGKEYYLIPGSTLHGLFRSWITRLAAKEGKTVSDSRANYDSEKYKADELGWMFNKELTVNEIDANYPVESLFGSLHKAGRLHITDALCPVSKAAEQHRKHVALDAISGGAIEHLLFDNDVLTSGEFTFTLIVKDVKEHEAKWLAQTLKAIDLGVLRIGSSKASGRLELKEQPKSTGKYCDEFTGIKPYYQNT